MHGLLLDFDRTLVDLQSFTDYEAAVADVHEALGEVELSETPPTDWTSKTHEAMAILVSLTDRPASWQQASDLIERHELDAVSSGVAMPGLGEFLAATHGRHRAIVTLLGPRALDAACHRFGVDVPVRFGREASYRPKPAPDQLLAACTALETDPSMSVFVGDSSWDEAAAVAAGCRFVGVTNGGPNVFAASTSAVPNLASVIPAIA